MNIKEKLMQLKHNRRGETMMALIWTTIMGLIGVAVGAYIITEVAKVCALPAPLDTFLPIIWLAVGVMLIMYVLSRALPKGKG